jgi:hypothetical protein
MGVMLLQRSAGNAAVARLIAGRPRAPLHPRPAPAALLRKVLDHTEDVPEREPVLPPDAVTAADQAEFDLLRKHITDKSAKVYVKHRNDFFGGREEYTAFAAESDAELAGAEQVRAKLDLKGDAQPVYYRWVRKAYLNAGVTDVPKRIGMGMTPAVADAMAKVQERFRHRFGQGGFNPRPQKNPKLKYVLGTISEHAMGNAVDIESDTNPILSLKDWDFIQHVAGKTVNRGRGRWKSEPRKLWEDIVELNRLWVAQIQAMVKRSFGRSVESNAFQEQLGGSWRGLLEPGGRGPLLSPPGAAKTQPGSREKGPITDENMAANEFLNEFLKNNKELIPRQRGFFTLQWELVEALHGQGFTWGATFTHNVDLHHFENPTAPGDFPLPDPSSDATTVG